MSVAGLRPDSKQADLNRWLGAIAGFSHRHPQLIDSFIKRLKNCGNFSKTVIFPEGELC